MRSKFIIALHIITCAFAMILCAGIAECEDVYIYNLLEDNIVALDVIGDIAIYGDRRCKTTIAIDMKTMSVLWRNKNMNGKRLLGNQYIIYLSATNIEYVAPATHNTEAKMDVDEYISDAIINGCYPEIICRQKYKEIGLLLILINNRLYLISEINKEISGFYDVRDNMFACIFDKMYSCQKDEVRGIFSVVDNVPIDDTMFRCEKDEQIVSVDEQLGNCIIMCGKKSKPFLGGCPNVVRIVVIDSNMNQKCVYSNTDGIRISATPFVIAKQSCIMYEVANERMAERRTLIIYDIPNDKWLEKNFKFPTDQWEFSIEMGEKRIYMSDIEKHIYCYDIMSEKKEWDVRDTGKILVVHKLIYINIECIIAFNIIISTQKDIPIKMRKLISSGRLI